MVVIAFKGIKTWLVLKDLLFQHFSIEIVTAALLYFRFLLFLSLAHIFLAIIVYAQIVIDYFVVFFPFPYSPFMAFCYNHNIISIKQIRGNVGCQM